MEQKNGTIFAKFRNTSYLCRGYMTCKLTFMESTIKKRTREEVRAAFKEAMRKKKEWIEESNVFLEQIHKERQAGLI